jgi:hypothetical protein
MIITVPPGQAPHSGGFSERDKLLVELLRPHLHAVYQDSHFPRSSAGLRDRCRELKGLQSSWAVLALGFAGDRAGSCCSAAVRRSCRALDA